MVINRRVSRITGVGAVCSAIATGAVWAADLPSGEGTEVQEVVVAAQKRSENVQSVPSSVNVVSQAQLEKFGTTRLGDLARNVPALEPPSGLNVRAPAIRGISSFASSQGVPTAVGIIVDDVPQSNWSTLANELSDVERVEVLEGPQFTLSGRNAAGGLVNIVTRAPSQTWAGTLDVDLTEDQERSFRGFLSGPLTDGTAFSLSAYSHQFRGNVFNAGSNTWQNSFGNEGVRLKLRSALTSHLTMSVSGYYLTQDNTQQSLALGGGLIIYAGPGAVFAFDPQGRSPAALLGEDIGPRNTRTNSPRNSRLVIKDRGGVVRFDYDLPGATLSSLSSLYRSRQNNPTDFVSFDFSSTLIPTVIAPGFDGYATDVRGVNEFSQELRLVSTGQGALKYVLGAIYTDTQNTFLYDRVIFPFHSSRDTTTRSAALYGRATVEFIRDNFVTLGLRGQHDSQGYDWQFFEIPGVQPAGVTSGRTSYSFGAGDVSLQHKFTSDVMTYISYAQGETGRAYDVEDNVTALGTANQPGGSFGQLPALPSEKVKSGEIGLKSEWLDRHLRINLSAFYADYTNYQLQAVTLDPDNPGAAPVLKLLSIGAVNTRGVEADGQLRFDDGTTVSLAAAYIRAKLTKFPNAQCYSLQTAAQGCINGVQPSLAGATMPNSPELKGNVSVDHAFRTPGLPFDPEVTLVYRYQSDVNFDVLQNPYSRLGGYGILNLRAGIRARSDGWSVSLYANNVLDKRYYTGLGQSSLWSGAPVIAGGLPRDASRYFGVAVSSRF